MIDPTTELQPMPLAPVAPTPSPDLQRYRLLLILREVPGLVKPHLSGPQGLMLATVVNRAVKQTAAQVAAMSDAQTQCLMSFLLATLSDANDSGLADEQFTERFIEGYAALDAIFSPPDSAA